MDLVNLLWGVRGAWVLLLPHEASPKSWSESQVGSVSKAGLGGSKIALCAPPRRVPLAREPRPQVGTALFPYRYCCLWVLLRSGHRIFCANILVTLRKMRKFTCPESHVSGSAQPLPGPPALWDPWLGAGTRRERTHKYGQEDGSLDHPPVRAGVVIPAPRGQERWLWHPLAPMGPGCPPATSLASPLPPLLPSCHGTRQKTEITF